MRFSSFFYLHYQYPGYADVSGAIAGADNDNLPAFVKFGETGKILPGHVFIRLAHRELHPAASMILRHLNHANAGYGIRDVRLQVGIAGCHLGIDLGDRSYFFVRTSAAAFTIQQFDVGTVRTPSWLWDSKV